MSRLNLQKPPVDNKAELTTGNSSSANIQAKAANSESSNSDTESDSSDSLSFLKENQQQQQNQQNANVNSKNGCHSKQQQPPLNLITNTPPVKLQATPKFIEPSKVMNCVHPSDTGIGQSKVNPPAGMSVSYAFMKNNNQINSTSCLPPNQDISNNQQKVLQQAQPQYISNLPKFLQTANQSYFPPANQQSFNQNPFSQQQQPPNISSSSSSSSSQNSVIQQQLSPTNSDAPFVYMVEKTSNILTPQSAKTRPIHQQQSEDRPPSPQESICSRMSDSSIPSIIKQELTKNTKPQNDFKALFNKLNQQSDINLQKQQAKQQQFLVKANNNMMPAFNFLKSSHTNFGAQPHQQAYFSNLNTPTNNNQHQANLNFSDLDCTYSPKVFQNEGTNSRYDTTDDEEEEEPSACGDTHHENLVQNSTANEAKSLQLEQDDQDELLLENFIKEMLPPVKSTSPVPPTRSRMANSISSEAPFTHLASKTKIKSSGSSSSLNSLPVSKPRMNFSKNSEKSVKTTATSVTRCTPQKNKAAVSRIANTSVPVNKPEMPAKKTQPIATKVVTKVSAPVPVIAMTKTAQLRAKIASTNSNAQQSNTLNSSINNPVRSAKPKAPVASQRVNRLKENINTTKTGSSVALNPHLDHLSRAGVRRKSFTCGATTSAAAPSPLCNKPLKKPNPIGDTSVSSLSNSTNSRAATTPAIASTKPKATWK